MPARLRRRTPAPGIGRDNYDYVQAACLRRSFSSSDAPLLLLFQPASQLVANSGKYLQQHPNTIFMKQPSAEQLRRRKLKTVTFTG